MNTSSEDTTSTIDHGIHALADSNNTAATEQLLHLPNTAAEEAHDAASCVVCAHARKHSWWGPALAPAKSHCRDCHRSWASSREGHCTRCHAHFADVRAFDYHIGEGACNDPSSAARADGRPRLIAKERPFGVVWAVIDYRTHTRPYITASA
jgi:hypothetical protein